MKSYDDMYVLFFFSSHTFIFKTGGLDQAIKVSGHVYVCRGIECASFYDFRLNF